MTQRLFVFFCLLFSFSLLGQQKFKSVADYPDYTAVVEHLFAKYDVDSIHSGAELRLERTPSGWQISVINITDSKNIQRQVFWDNQSKHYKPVGFMPPSAKVPNEDLKESFLEDQVGKYFALSPYYGYPGWSKDVIAAYSTTETLTDSELYALGFAYNSIASDLLNNNSGLSDPTTMFNLGFRKNAMTKEQLETYLFYQHKGIETYKKLKEKNPKFETVVGQIGIKYANEIVSSFLNLRIYQNETEAQKEFSEDGIYSKTFMNYCKSLLDSCEPNAILFTAGDNDTFPVLYYQAKYHYRTDILIVNTSLLQNERYNLLVHEKILDSEGLPTSLETNFMISALSDAVLIEDKKGGPIALNELLKFVANDANEMEIISGTYRYIPTTQLSFARGPQKMDWKIDLSYLYRTHLTILDVIASNNWKRPLYFADNNSPDCYLGLSKYLQFEGLAYKLTAKEGLVEEDERGYINELQLTENLSKIYSLGADAKPAVEDRQLVMNYRAVYNRLANYYLAKNNTKKAIECLDKCMNLYTNEAAYFSFDLFGIIECYYKLNQFKKGKALADQLLYNLNQDLNNYSRMSPEERKSRNLNNIRLIGELNGMYRQ